MNPKITISQILILVAAIFTALATFDNSFYQYGLNNVFLGEGKYHIYMLQIFSSQFLHGGLFHLVMNALFIIIFGKAVENILGEKTYILFFIFSSIFIALGITFFSQGNTVGMSGFAMAIIAYYTLYLKQKNHPDYKGGITALGVNIAIGFVPGISLAGHVFGAMAGALFFLTIKAIKK